MDRRSVCVVGALSLVACWWLVAGAAPVAQAAPAIVWHTGENKVILVGVDANGNLVGGPRGDLVVLVENGKKVSLKGSGQSFNHSGKTQVFRGFRCFIIVPSQSGDNRNVYVYTNDSQAVVTRDGKCKLQCTYKKPDGDR